MMKEFLKSGSGDMCYWSEEKEVLVMVWKSLERFFFAGAVEFGLGFKGRIFKGWWELGEFFGKEDRVGKF